jgi:hypothetical protein
MHVTIHAAWLDSIDNLAKQRDKVANAWRQTLDIREQLALRYAAHPRHCDEYVRATNKLAA